MAASVLCSTEHKTDAATGEYGDLLDLIASSRRLTSLRETLDEARRFLGAPRPDPAEIRPWRSRAPRRPSEAARRLFAMARPLKGTLAETYLAGRGITDLRDCDALRFHPRCWYRGEAIEPQGPHREAWPALIAAVTDDNGTLTGAHRTWLNPSGLGKAPVACPRRAMGRLLGAAVRIGEADDVMAAGEGLETMLSLRQAIPALPVAAALSANHLAAFRPPKRLRRLYIAHDQDLAGEQAMTRLAIQAQSDGICVISLSPRTDDFNEDLQTFGAHALKAMIARQLEPEDVARFLRAEL